MKRSLMHALVLPGAIGLALVGPAAQAALIERVTEPFDVTNFSTCPGTPDFVVETHGVGSETYTLKRRANGAYYFFDARQSSSWTYTNTTTGKKWYGEFHNHEHDTKILAVSGNVYTVKVQYSSSFRVLDGARKFDSHSVTNNTFTVKVDTKGTDTPTDDEGSFFELLRERGHNTVGEFCDDAVRFTS